MLKHAITYTDFQPGDVLGEAVTTFDGSMTHAWRRIFGKPAGGSDTEGAERASLAIVLMMRAYCSVVTPRPPGNVHARQRFHLHGVPLPGESIRTVVSCSGKEIKRERRYVELRTEGSGNDGRPLFTGDMTIVWAR